MRTLVLGGYGAVGGRIVALLRAAGAVAWSAGRDAARADRMVNLTRPYDSLPAALSDVDVVVNAAGIEDPSLVALITGHGVAFVDITATTSYVAAVERLGLPAPPVRCRRPPRHRRRAVDTAGRAVAATRLGDQQLHIAAEMPVDQTPRHERPRPRAV